MRERFVSVIYTLDLQRWDAGLVLGCACWCQGLVEWVRKRLECGAGIVFAPWYLHSWIESKRCQMAMIFCSTLRSRLDRTSPRIFYESVLGCFVMYVREIVLSRFVAAFVEPYNWFHDCREGRQAGETCFFCVFR